MKFIAILTLFLCSIGFAGTKPAATASDIKKIEALATGFFLKKYEMKKSNLLENVARPEHYPPQCDPLHPYPPDTSSECIDTVCDKLGTYGCDQQSEITAVAQACRGVDASCIDASCSHLGTYGCDQMSEIQEVANSCRSVFDGRCMEVVCSKLGTYGCDQMSEISQVGTMCRGRVDSDCIENVCQRLGTYGCDQMSELQQVARSCGGQ